MRRCMFCGRTVDVVLWRVDDVVDAVDGSVPACHSCAEEHGLSVVQSKPEDGDLARHDSCQCCGRELPSPRSWPMTVWVQDRRRLMAVCNTCRVEYALQAVFASSPPAGERSRRKPEPPREGSGTPPSD
jgi:hypothetical protein